VELGATILQDFLMGGVGLAVTPVVAAAALMVVVGEEVHLALLVPLAELVELLG